MGLHTIQGYGRFTRYRDPGKHCHIFQTTPSLATGLSTGHTRVASSVCFRGQLVHTQAHFHWSQLLHPHITTVCTYYLAESEIWNSFLLSKQHCIPLSTQKAFSLSASDCDNSVTSSSFFLPYNVPDSYQVMVNMTTATHDTLPPIAPCLPHFGRGFSTMSWPP